MKRTDIYILFFFLLFFSACKNHKPKLPDTYLRQANKLFQESNTTLAKTYLDSVHILFPENIDARKKAVHMMYKVEFKEENRNLQYYDSVFTLRKRNLDSCRSKFVLVRDTIYENSAVYVHVEQKNNDYPRTRLKCEIAMNGDVTLTSVYGGQVPIKHTSFKVSSGDVFAETLRVPIDEAFNYSFKDLGVTWEFVTYVPKVQNGTLLFIYKYADKNIKVTLNGDHKYIFYLEKLDKSIIKESVDFAIIVRDVDLLKRNISKSKAKIELLRKRMANQKQLQKHL